MDIETVAALGGAVVLVLTGIAAFRKDKSSADNFIVDSAVDLIKELRETIGVKDTIIKEQREEIAAIKHELELCRGMKHRPRSTHKGL